MCSARACEFGYAVPTPDEFGLRFYAVPARSYAARDGVFMTTGTVESVSDRVGARL